MNAALVVTYNRYNLLKECLSRLLNQSAKIDHILVVDNASSDGTPEKLERDGYLDQPGISLMRMPVNTGGAGGFSAGLEALVEQGFEWVWMMDDDAAPNHDAFEELLVSGIDPANVYGSLAINGPDTAWATTLLGAQRRVVNLVAEVPRKERVQSLPFLGFMIHRDLVRRIGLPDAGYFIAADDIEYCLRAEQSGAQIFILGKSQIHHPKSDRYRMRVMHRDLICLRLPPWKRYYDTRNRLLIAKKYYGWRWLTQTVPGSFMRLLAALMHEPAKLAQTKAFFAGFVDGVLGLSGRRHDWWRIAS